MNYKRFELITPKNAQTGCIDLVFFSIALYTQFSFVFEQASAESQIQICELVFQVTVLNTRFGFIIRGRVK
jgi:hypothetical protein